MLAYDATTATATLEWNESKVDVDITAVLTTASQDRNARSLDSLKVRIGDLVNVIGYVETTTLQPCRSSVGPSFKGDSLIIRALLWWNAGRMTSSMQQAYEDVVKDRHRLQNTYAAS